MTTKTKTQKAQVEPKAQAAQAAPVAQPKTTPKKPYKIPTFGRNKVEKPAVYNLALRGGQGRAFPVTYMLKAEDIVYDPETNSERTIRYIPGETSIFKDEQSKEARLKEPIMFTNGLLVVSKQDPNLRKFLDMHNGNASNPNRKGSRGIVYRKVDNEVNAKKNIEKVRSEVDALSLALTMPIDKLVGYAKVLGVNIDKSTEEIRWDMKVLAQKDPIAFIDGLSDPRTEVREIILKAKEYSILDFTKNKVCWIVGTERPVITVVPIGVDAIDKMVDFCMSDEGSNIMEEINKRLEKFA
tara:strand:+ start:63 stop:953 length:891 start_codon:yes stop_codon:yes gene_type:complete